MQRELFPSCFSYHNDSFSYKDWSFIVQKAREGTARYVVHNEFNVINSYTLEVSLFGPLNGTFLRLTFYSKSSKRYRKIAFELHF